MSTHLASFFLSFYLGFLLIFRGCLWFISAHEQHVRKQCEKTFYQDMGLSDECL